MGKKRVIKKGSDSGGSANKARILSRKPKKKVSAGTLYIESTYNNTKGLLADKSGNCLVWTSCGMLGFRGAKKGTPFAAAKVGELLGEKADNMGMKEVNIIVKGIGAGRESSIRSFAAKGIEVSMLQDKTPVPHNGPRLRKPRRV